ncbi:hypothetical protein FGRMN_7145 [Fusarium graminum]|nr:hypothetical protein FGRMN_7145 [Fusarium graminum]
MPPNQREVQRKLMKKYNISFDGPIDTIRDPHWPSSCDSIFEQIKKAGRTDYLQYQESIAADASRASWRSQVQKRAKRITEKARQCIEGRKNESGWRLSLESEIMARFSVDIACPDCCGRLWRSEQEVIANEQIGDDTDDYNSLKARQRRRQPCNCNPNNVAQDIPEQGISPLFDDRAEEAIRYSGELRSELPKREDRPDRVYGLRVNERLSRLLQSAEDTNEDIKVSPFKSDGDPLVFPFLVIEAKSEKGSDSVSDTQVQTAFAIRELLSIQYQLVQLAEDDEEQNGDPLHVVRLWSGGIDSPDCALQLLLIVDYIVDWARDTYREGIARKLQKIACLDTRSLARDDDVFSLSGNLRGWTPGFADTGKDEESDFVGDPMQAFDCEEGVFRDARFIRSRVLGLMITEDNFEEFLQTGSSNNETRSLATSLLKEIQEGCRIKGHMLDDLEVLWTGTDRNIAEKMHSEGTFIVVITSVFYVEANWDQVRELSYLAVSESLISDLAEICRIPLPSAQVLERVRTITSLTAFGELLKGTVRQNVVGKSNRVWMLLPTVPIGEPDKIRRHMSIQRRNGSSSREFVFSVYQKYKVGRNDPTTPMFRMSSVLDELAKPNHSSQRQSLLPGVEWPCKDRASVAEAQHEKGLVHVVFEAILRDKTPSLCIFILEPSVCDFGIPSLFLSATPKRYLVMEAIGCISRLRSIYNLKEILSKPQYTCRPAINRLNKALQKPYDPASAVSLSKRHILTTGFVMEDKNNLEDELNAPPFQEANADDAQVPVEITTPPAKDDDLAEDSHRERNAVRVMEGRGTKRSMETAGIANEAEITAHAALRAERMKYAEWIMGMRRPTETIDLCNTTK